ncbi:MAG TPA: TetR/AcrR family transcriptional regulator [Ktedonosporobacter sp.]|nr:TetR/AcrR family transcriptional regulator [Ktedonosporobacter sp.]
MLAKDNLQKGDKREAILQAALELIAQHGLQHTPMSLISKHSKASAGVIYHYFESKDDLLQSLYCRIKGDMGRAWLAADDPQQPLAKRFQSLLLAMFRYCIAHPREVAFLEQYESLPLVQQQDTQLSDKVSTLDDLLADLHTQDLPSEGKALYALIADLRTQDLLKDLPLEVIGEFTFGVALRLSRQSAAGLVRLDEPTLANIAKACWDAIAR